MIVRQIEPRLLDLMTRFPAVALLGPRQAGKTTLAHSVADQLGAKAVYLDLELPSHRAQLADPELYFAAHKNDLVILDEIQRTPEIFQSLRGVIDQRRRVGKRSKQFLLLGSASMDLLQQSSESLAGRIAYQELTPFLATETDSAGQPSLNQPSLNQLWTRGGFPDSFLAADDATSYEWRGAFIQTYLERDIPQLGPRIPAETLHRFWQMLAYNHGQLFNAARIAGSLGVSGQTVARYLDLMVDLFLVRHLAPWTSHGSKRLVRSPKVYVRDSGLVHALLRLEDYDQLLGHPIAGCSWEGFVMENLLAIAPPGTEAYFYRTAAGAEIDLLLQIGPRKLWAIEVKRSLDPRPSKGFYNACDDVKATRRFVVYPGEDRYRIDPQTEAIPLLTLMKTGLA
jgi:predicted AAA+ superfamily ATPase